MRLTTISLSEERILKPLGLDPRSTLYVPGQVYSSKNSMTIMSKPDGHSEWQFKGRRVRPFIMKSANAQLYAKTAVMHMNVLRNRWMSITAGMTPPLPVGFMLIRETHGKLDFPNLIQAVLDAMVEAKWIRDDDTRNILPYPLTLPNGTFPTSRMNAGVIISVYKTPLACAFPLKDYQEPAEATEEEMSTLQKYVEDYEDM